MNRPTIAAICTPRGFGGVGIVKISGPDSVKIARHIFRKKSDRNRTETQRLEPETHFKSHHLNYGVIVNPSDGRRLDEVLLAAMQGPGTYTGEDVVEINAHGGPVVLNKILELVMEQGADLAAPGEFTRRAFLNGRIDLTQAEAVVDLINAKTTTAAALASAQIAGHLRHEIEEISNRLKTLIAHNEAQIDFPEEVDGSVVPGNAIATLETLVVEPLERILVHFREARIFRDGLRLAVVGRPNVGKSSLMNRLVKADKVIVTDIPGTTRDAIEDFINIGGVPVVVVDTAGLQETDNPVEIIGIEKTFEKIESADLILFIVEEGRGIQAEDHRIYEKIRDKERIIVINKKDLEDSDRRTDMPVGWKAFKKLRVSALSGEGLDVLEQEIFRFATGAGQVGATSEYALNLRQKELISKSISAARGAIESFERDDPGELTAVDLGECAAGLDQILGIHIKEDVLGRIFDEFCIGK